MTDLHHLLLGAVIASYDLFPPGQLPPIADFSDALTRTIQGSFEMALQLAAPFIFAGIVFYLGIGLLTRLMPQIQIFFIALPVKVLFALFVFMASISGMMFVFLEYFETGLERFVTP